MLVEWQGEYEGEGEIQERPIMALPRRFSLFLQVERSGKWTYASSRQTATIATGISNKAHPCDSSISSLFFSRT